MPARDPLAPDPAEERNAPGPYPGRTLVVAIISLLLTTSLLVIVLFNLARGPERLPQQVMRFVLTCALCLYLYRGANWARWFVGVTSALGGAFGLLTGTALVLQTPLGIGPLLMGLVYCLCALGLLFHPAIKAHFGVGEAG